MKPTLTTPLQSEKKDLTANAVKSVNAPASVTFGPKSSALLSRSELLSSLRSDSRAAFLVRSEVLAGIGKIDNLRREDEALAEGKRVRSNFLAGREINLIVLHCSDTKPSQKFTIEKLKACHKARGFGEWPGYHFYIRRDGTLHYCRPLNVKGCHVSGYNANSIGICTEGGHRENEIVLVGGNKAGIAGGNKEKGEGKNLPTRVEKYEDNRTAEQKVVLHELLTTLHEMFPSARICGHRDLPGVAKACPCYDAEKEYKYLQ